MENLGTKCSVKVTVCPRVMLVNEWQDIGPLDVIKCAWLNVPELDKC